MDAGNPATANFFQRLLAGLRRLPGPLAVLPALFLVTGCGVVDHFSKYAERLDKKYEHSEFVWRRLADDMPVLGLCFPSLLALMVLGLIVLLGKHPRPIASVVALFAI